MEEKKTILDVKHLRVDFTTDQGTVQAVRDVSFSVKEGEILGIVGESGSGKSVTMYSVMGLLAQNGSINEGEIVFNGESIARKDFPDNRSYEKKMREIRGNTMAMIFQDPMTFLNPVLTIGKQIRETLLNHNPKMTKKEANERAIELMRKVGIPAPEKRINQYPFEFSGGMRQRIVIAIALANKPKLIIADEPTTALDVTIQAQVLELIQEMSRQTGAAVIMITHDLGVVASLCDRINIMYGGRLAETGTDREIFYEPNHPYTKGLLNCINNPEDDDKELTPIPGSPPDLLKPPAGCPFVDRCSEAMKICKTKMPVETIFSDTHRSACWLNEKRTGRRHSMEIQNEIKNTADDMRDVIVSVEHLKTYFNAGKTWGKKQVVKAVDDVSFQIHKGETYGLVGESGCGKSTLGRTIVKINEPTDGKILVNGEDITHLSGQKLKKFRKNIQLIFQDPYASLNPRMTVGEIIREPMVIHHIYQTRKEQDDRVAELLKIVGLKPDHVRRYPHEFSGGQRQRISIARTLALNPEFIVCDEPISALDVSIQAQIINLLKNIQKELGIAYLFIAHDLSMVKHISDRIGVMYLGHLVEEGDSKELYANPMHPYTKALLSAVPIPDPLVGKSRKRIMLEGELPSPINPPSGCPFRTRCPYANEKCANEMPKMKEINGRKVACHMVG